ncbi:MAG: helix-turn-helix domain-containing protein [Lachnospiraceae bacterium]|nr:helix-turn-helix domain-containing protein [Lachnospiraceae bacterium]
MTKKVSTFQQRFIQAMEIRGMRQVDVSTRSGLDKAQISQYKTGKYEPMQDALHKLAEALNVNVSWLMGYDVPMEIDRKKLEQEVAACELIEQCYGSGARKLIMYYVKLNEIGQKKIMEEVQDLIQLPKYTEQKREESSEKKAI